MDIQRTINPVATQQTRIRSNNQSIKSKTSIPLTVIEEKQVSKPIEQPKGQPPHALQQKVEEKQQSSHFKYAYQEYNNLTQSAQKAVNAYQTQLQQPEQAELQQISEIMGVDLFV